MRTCELCGKEYDQYEASDIFESNDDRSVCAFYNQFGRDLCGECAISEYEAGHYYETCENCGKSFYPEDEHSDFQSQVSYKVSDADMYEHGIHCADCAASLLFDAIKEEFGEDDEDDEDHEGLSVYEAADIWASHGKDEDYMFGYTEDELENAL